MIRRLYPYGKKKAFNVTYDDGVLQDFRFVKLLDRYGIKGTFNLNSALAENRFEWTHESGLVVKRLPPDILPPLYAGHEAASHTRTHPCMAGLTKEQILYELAQDKAGLEALFQREIKGFAVPFDYYSERIAACVKECGFAYARISEESGSFAPPKDFYNWRATVFHCSPQLDGLVQRFLNTDEELALFQIVGHTYDLDVENKWAQMENIFRTISEQSDILPMTNIELAEYLKAMEAAQITDRYIQNNSGQSLWFDLKGAVREVQPGAVCFF